MIGFGANSRLVRLHVAIRLRRLGWWPWLVLLGWIALAASQEPQLLRAFGIRLSWQGGWSGAAILLVALAAQGAAGNSSSSVLRQSVITGVVGFLLGLLVAVAQAGLAWLADALVGVPTPLLDAASSAAGFALAWSPTAVAVAVAFGGCVTPGWARLVILAPLAFSVAVSAICFSAPSTTTVVACALATLGAGCRGALPVRATTRQ